jgi:hypothetical protein
LLPLQWSICWRVHAVAHARGGAHGEARFVQPEPGSPIRVLQIRAGADALAELTDLDGDGVVDVTLVNER